MKITIRQMEYNDLDAIMEIEHSSFSVPWSRDSFEAELNNPMALYLCLICDEEVAAYAGLWKICDEGHITNVAVLPKYRGLGLSKLLMNSMFEVAAKSEINKMTLEVRENNNVAINLYEQIGFVNCGKRPKYYSNPVEDAIIMWKDIECEMNENDKK